MSEQFLNPIEEHNEHVPSSEEVQGVLEQLVSGEAYTETRRREDEKGLYLLDVLIQNADGSTTEYSYIREGRYLEGGSKDTVINVAFYDADGMPVSGSPVAKYINRNWHLIPQ